MRGFLGAVASLFQEFLIVVGISLIGYGCYLIWAPLAPLVVGMIFLAFGVLPLLIRRGES